MIPLPLQVGLGTGLTVFVLALCTGIKVLARRTAIKQAEKRQKS